MAAWMQNAAQVAEAPRTGIAPTRNSYPRSVSVMGPSNIPEGQVNPGSTLPSGGFRASPVFVGQGAAFGRHDGLGGRLMEVQQSDTYDSQGNWNHGNPSGVYNVPNAWHGILPLVRLQPTTSAHPGLNLATGAGPQMLYRTPPAFSAQTTPIYALGL